MTVRRVSQAAGMSTIGIYSHFDSKEGLVGAVWGVGFSRLVEALEFAPLEAGVAGVVTLAERYVAWAQAHPHLYQLMFGAVRPDMAIDDRSRGVSLAAFEKLVDACASTADDPARTALVVWQYLHGVASLAIAGVTPPGVTQVVDLGEVVRTLAGSSHS